MQERFLSGVVCDAFTSDFDVECVGTDIDAVQSKADALKTGLQTILPASIVYSTFCMGIFVNEHSDDYISRTVLDTDTGFHVATFQVRFFHRASI